MVTLFFHILAKLNFNFGIIFKTGKIIVAPCIILLHFANKLFCGFSGVNECGRRIINYFFYYNRFRTNPQLVLKARPAVGARNIRFAHISNWIEHKLSKEFEKVLVLPNMEDISVDVMTPTPVQFE